MRRFVGLDLHKRSLTFQILDDQGKPLFGGEVAVERSTLLAFARKTLRSGDHVAVEMTSNTWAVVEILAPFVEKILVSNPLTTRAIASAKIKTDKVDAKVLAHLLRCDYLPEVWQPDEKTRRLRSMTSARQALGSESTAIKNRIHSLLAQRLIIPEYDLFSPKGRDWLKTLELDDFGQLWLKTNLDLLQIVETKIQELEKHMAQVDYEIAAIGLVMTLPGVGLATAQALIGAWGDIDRFPDADHAASYLGLAPSTRQSANHCYHGAITKQGNTSARWHLIQAAQHLDDHPGPLGASFRKMLRRKHRNIVVTAHARRLALVAWHMLRNREPYRYATPAATETKLAHFRVLATGIKRQRGPVTGTERSPNYGSATRSRTIPSLDHIYEREGLPPRKGFMQLPAGERDLLVRTDTLDFVETTAKPKIKTRAKTKNLIVEATTST
jgi:transposase